MWHGILSDYSSPLFVDGSGRHAIFFDYNIADWGHLYGRFFGAQGAYDGTQIRLWPIPYKAAEGIRWFGEIMAAGDGGLRDHVAEAVTALGEMDRWSFESSNWKDRNLDDGFKLRKIKPSYIGVMKEPENIFP